MTIEQDLNAARALAAAGVPVFVAPPAGNQLGFALPYRWSQLEPDPAVVDAWQPGMALGAVMGRGIDALDFDPRNGGDPAALDVALPRSWGMTFTPSGGLHSFVRSLECGSRDGIAPGVDLKGGRPDGSGRGFVFLPPTAKKSKKDGQVRQYSWAPDGWVNPAVFAVVDDSGRALAAKVRALLSTDAISRPVEQDGSLIGQFLAQREPQSMIAAERAMAEQLRRVREFDITGGHGFRGVLRDAAFCLGGYVGGGYLDEARAQQLLEEAVAVVWGTPDQDDRLWIQQGLLDGPRRPFHVYTPEDEARYGEAAQAVAAVRHEKWSPWPLIGDHFYDPQFCADHQDHAKAVLDRMLPVMRYSPQGNVWLKADLGRWQPWQGLASWAISTLAERMPPGETPLPAKPADYTEGHWQAHRRSVYRNAAKSAGIETKMKSLLLGNDHPATINLEDLDADPWVLWAGGVPWDLRASVERPAVREDISLWEPHLHTAAVLPELVPTPRWDAFVAAVWPDPEVRAWALRVLAVALSGVPDAVLPVLYGPARTGKTALVSLLLRLLGTYGISADPRLLGAGADSAHASIVYALKGARLAFIDEGPRKGHLATERLKQLTGGGRLTGNEMRMNPVTFDPTHTLVMTTNEEPGLQDPALEARLRVIPCEADPAEVRIARRALDDRAWAAEAPGVLALMMRECALWAANPDSALTAAAPELIRENLAEMTVRQNPVDMWVDERTVPFEAGTESRQLFVSFLAWYEANLLFKRQQPPSETAFGRRLTDLGYPATGGFGPRRNRNGRPLAVMGGYADGYPSDAGGTATAPSGAQNARSSSVSSVVADSADSNNPIFTHKEVPTTPHTTQPLQIGKSPRTLVPPADSAVFAGQRPAEAVPGVSETLVPGEQLGLPIGITAGQPVFSDELQPAESPAKPSRARLTPEEKAERAAARKLIKDEEKAAARAAKIAELAGPVVELPAVVDRRGQVLPCTAADAAGLVLAGIRADGALTVDVETSGFPVGHRLFELKTVQLGNHAFAAVFHPARHADTIRELLAAAPTLHAFSAQADLVPLAHAGLIPDLDEAWARMVDPSLVVQLAGMVDTERESGGLKALCAKVMGEQATAPAADERRGELFRAAGWLTDTDPDTPVERNGWAQVDPRCSTMVVYAASDVLDTAELVRRLPEVPSGPASTPAAILGRERGVQAMTARVTSAGLALGQPHIAVMRAEHAAKRAELGATLGALGVVNPGSPQQVAEAATRLGAALPTTKTGKPSAAKTALEPLKNADGQLGELVRAQLGWRHYDTALKMFLTPFSDQIANGDGRIRPTIYTLGTDTGRMSAVRPNIQQLPREGGIRACIVADPGYLLIGADFSGVELRVAAALSGDANLRQLIADGRDLHWEVARMVFGPDATKSDRYNVKRMVFGRLYGGGIPTLAAQCGVSESITASVVDSLDAIAPGVKAFDNELRRFVKSGGKQFPTYSGRVVHFPEGLPHKALNYAVQGTARELTVDACLDWAQTPWGTCVMFPVHDEIDALVPAQDAANATQELVRCMTRELNGVAIIAEPSEPSPFWADSV